MAPDQYAQMLDALRDLETRVNATVAAGLTAVNVTVAALTDAHHKALLDQERRNSTFADRQRLDELAGQVARSASELNRAGGRLDTLEERYDTIISRLDELASQSARGTVALLSGATNYLILVVLMLGSNLLVFLLSHVVAR